MSTRCKWCSLGFPTRSDLQEHLKRDIMSHLYYCQHCQFTFKSYKALKEHYRTSAKHRSGEVTDTIADAQSYCRHCRRQFDAPGLLVTHFTKAHNSDLHCQICDVWFSRASNLRDHMASPVHNEPEIPCPHCSKLLKTTSGVAHHLEAKCLKKITAGVVQWDVGHQITSPVYTNRIREVDSDDEDDDILVLRRNDGLQQILEVCASADSWDASVQAFVCPVPDCLHGFAKLGHLNQHLRSQFHRTDPNTFRCPKCESHFSVVSALVQHLESGVCGLAESNTVKEIYSGLHDIFKRLLKF
ncbi:hypothetical protein M408DRAFT_328942 [Serendipita vermifera MAFF 305830]|uniref:C2H2-type domain-containing protein n=1 Tax=Serendipita vermifera MAFF 305830 TaxID=933852 RepID=A0A0C3BAZ1_SERVB|nr:hypothetical protein M408DRAFT_328942 [Serendipita vermifera MAFF 305830]